MDRCGTARILRGRLATVHACCTKVEMHLIRKSHVPNSDVQGGSVRTDLARDRVITAMRRALSDAQLTGCRTEMSRLQTTHVNELTMERPSHVRWQERSKEQVHSDTLLATRLDPAHDADSEDSIGGTPMLWLEWDRHRVAPEIFPSVTQHNQRRHCIRRTIAVGDNVTVFFETSTDSVSHPIYRVWLEITICSDLDGLSHDIARALSSIAE